jgi:hypothetical protein
MNVALIFYKDNFNPSLKIGVLQTLIKARPIALLRIIPDLLGVISGLLFPSVANET